MLHMASRNVCFLLNSVFWTCYQVIHYSYKIVVFDSCMLSYLCTFGQTVLYIIPIPKWCAFRLFLGFLIFLKLVVYAEKSPIQSATIYWVLLGGRQRIKKKKKSSLWSLLLQHHAICMRSIFMRSSVLPSSSTKPHSYQAATASGSLELGERWSGTNRTACHAHGQGKTTREASGYFFPFLKKLNDNTWIHAHSKYLCFIKMHKWKV